MKIQVATIALPITSSLLFIIENYGMYAHHQILQYTGNILETSISSMVIFSNLSTMKYSAIVASVKSIIQFVDENNFVSSTTGISKEKMLSLADTAQAYVNFQASNNFKNPNFKNFIKVASMADIFYNIVNTLSVKSDVNHLADTSVDCEVSGQIHADADGL